MCPQYLGIKSKKKSSATRDGYSSQSISNVEVTPTLELCMSVCMWSWIGAALPDLLKTLGSVAKLLVTDFIACRGRDTAPSNHPHLTGSCCGAPVPASGGSYSVNLQIQIGLAYLQNLFWSLRCRSESPDTFTKEYCCLRVRSPLEASFDSFSWLGKFSDSSVCGRRCTGPSQWQSLSRVSGPQRRAAARCGVTVSLALLFLAVGNAD